MRGYVYMASTFASEVIQPAAVASKQSAGTNVICSHEHRVKEGRDVDLAKLGDAGGSP